MDEREVERVGARTRRALSSLDDISVPSLAQIRDPLRTRSPWGVAMTRAATGVAVVIAIIVASAGLNAWRAPRSENAGATPTPSPVAAVPASALTKYLDVDGYRITVTVVSDPRYSPTGAPAAAYVSSVPGVGVTCEWERSGSPVARLTDAWGTTDAVVSTAGYSPVATGAHASATRGVPAGAVSGSTAAVVCGVVDDAGAHGVIGGLTLAQPSGVASLITYRWSGIAGDASAVAPCTGKQGANPLVAAFTSTAREVADWVEGVNEPAPVPPATAAPHSVNTAFRSMAPATPIYVCYFAGSYAPSVPPPGPGASAEPVIYDRALIFVDAGGTQIFPSKIGPSSQIPLTRPGGGRF